MRAKAARRMIVEYLEKRNPNITFGGMISARELSDLANYGALPGVTFDARHWNFPIERIYEISEVVWVWKQSRKKMKDMFDPAQRKFLSSKK